MIIILNQNEESNLFKEVNGQGGFQSLLSRLRQQYNRQTRELRLTDQDFERIPRYAFDYGNGGFEGRLRSIFEQHLGPNLGR
ncbi:MAG: aspartyl-tRNA synthetase [Sphingomonadales bacterium]|nr:aspartyl-tRNA synthetase [Sphingomonadales bacterium]